MRLGHYKSVVSNYEWRQLKVSNTTGAARRPVPPTTVQFGSSIGIGPVTFGEVIVKTAAAILVITLNTCV